MTDRKIFIYTMAAFMLLTLVSYIANGQTQRLSLRNAIDLAVNQNREIRVPASSHSSRESTASNKASGFAYFAVETADIQNLPAKPVNGFPADIIDKKPIIAEKVKNLYYQVLILQQLSALKSELIARNRNSASVAGIQMRADTSWVTEINNKLESDLSKTQSATKAATEKLLIFLGIDPRKNVELTELFVVDLNPSVPNAEQVFSLASENRADLKVLEIREKLADLHSKSSSEMLKTAVCNARSVRSQSFESEIAYRSTQKTRLNAIAMLKAEIADVVEDVLRTSVRLNTSDQSQKAANLNYGSLLQNYENGKASNDELVSAAKELTLAQTGHLEAVYDYLSASFSLDRTIGIL